MEPVRILICDDEVGMRMAVQRALRDYRVHLPDVEGEVSYVVEGAETGEDAIAKIEVEAPDILLLDYKLPGMSGLDVLERVTADDRDMLTIMITAYASIETAVTATKRGAYDFLPKPFTPEELKSVVRKASERLALRKQARHLAEERRKVRFQLISVIVHELKAPLAAIDGYLQIMKNHAIGKDIDAYDQVVDRTRIRLEGMQKLIIDLLDMARIESGQKKRELGDVDVVEVARQSMETVLPEATARGITVALHADDPVTMRADRGEIEMITNNLITNAVKYNRNEGRVDICITRSEGISTIAVADTGIGMTVDETAKLFGEFVRIKNDKTRNILGSGLGLSTVRKLADLYGGSVTVTSEPDVGSTFTVTIADAQDTSPKQ